MREAEETQNAKSEETQRIKAAEQQHLQEERMQKIAHHAMAGFAGYMIGYCIIAKGTGLTSAMTINLIDLVLAIMGRTPSEVFLRFLALCIYVLAVVLFTWLRIRTKVCREYVSIALDLAAMIAVTLMPAGINPMIIAYPMFFAFSFQYNAFPGCCNYGISTVFNSNNTRQATAAFTEFFLTKERGQLKRAWLYLGTILIFHFGVAASWIGVELLGEWASLVSVILLFVSFLSIRKGRSYRSMGK